MNKNTKKEKSSKNRISAREAAIAASDYFREVTGYARGVIIEEAEFDEKAKCWLITLGYEDLTDRFSPLFETGSKKAYKIFKVNATTGEVISMKIRKL